MIFVFLTTGVMRVKVRCSPSSDTVCECSQGFRCGNEECSFCVQECTKGQQPKDSESDIQIPNISFHVYNASDREIFCDYRAVRTMSSRNIQWPTSSILFKVEKVWHVLLLSNVIWSFSFFIKAMLMIYLSTHRCTQPDHQIIVPGTAESNVDCGPKKQPNQTTSPDNTPTESPSVGKRLMPPTHNSSILEESSTYDRKSYS